MASGMPGAESLDAAPSGGAMEACMGSWNERSPEFYRNLERDQRTLAENAVSTASRDIHLEFAERYRQQAEQLEAKMPGPSLGAAS